MSKDIPVIQTIVCVLWPSFLVSGVATILFFTAFDPHDLFPTHPELDRLAVYSVGFFIFWGLTGLSSVLTVYFGQPCRPGNPHSKCDTQ